MINKKYINLFAGGLVALNFYRVNPSIVPISTPTASPSIKIIDPNLIKNIEKIELKFTNKRGELKNVKVTAVATDSITVDNDGASVKVSVSANTHYRRKFWGKSTIAEIKVGDSVDVVGKWTNEAKTEIKAVLIRNLSIQKRLGVFFGNVKSITDTGFVMTTIHKGEEKVVIDIDTKLISRDEEPIKYSDIEKGHTLRVKGLWDSNSFTITEVTEIKDFSLPPHSTPTATPN
jgi:hypothetical protein